VFLFLTAAAGPLLRLALWLVARSGAFPFFHPRTDLVVFVLPFSQIDAFAIGGWFALYGRSRSALVPVALVAFALLIGCVTEYVATGALEPSSLGYRPYMRDAYKFLWAYTLLNVVFASILIHARDGKLLKRLFENPWLHYLGQISYGLYVFHFALIWIAQRHAAQLPASLQAVLALVGTIALSALSYELLEKRFIRSKDRFFAKRAVSDPPRPG
jgi:peptidoglycan/LPS O-acetylase OafA/YrhL